MKKRIWNISDTNKQLQSNAICPGMTSYEGKSVDTIAHMNLNIIH